MYNGLAISPLLHQFSDDGFNRYQLMKERYRDKEGRLLPKPFKQVW
jgi:hypothetical protein